MNSILYKKVLKIPGTSCSSPLGLKIYTDFYGNMVLYLIKN